MLNMQIISKEKLRKCKKKSTFAVGMKKVLKYIILIAWIFVAGKSNAGDTLRVLAIGNSFSIDALETEFYPICKNGGIELIVGNLYYGGCSLKQHAEFLDNQSPVYSYRTIIGGVYSRHDSVNMLRALDDRKWDIISLQQASHDSGIRSTYEPYLTMLIDSVKKHQPQAKLAWHQTWAYQSDAKHPAFPKYGCSQQTMYDSIVACTNYVLSLYPFDYLIPCGDAIQRARKTELGDTFCRDGYHLNHLYGRYLAALVWYKALTGKDVKNIRYRATDDNGQKMTKKQRRLCQQSTNL